jgi:hypothetical protein
MPGNITDSTKKTQRRKVVFRRSGEPLVTVAEDNIVRLHRLILLPPREDQLTRLARARDDLLEALVGILGPSAIEHLADLDEAIAGLKRESGP